MTVPETAETIDLARRAQRGGRPAIEDPVVRDQLVQLLIEARGIELCGARQRLAPLNQERPMSLGLSFKLMNTEFLRRMSEFAISIQGAKGAYYVGDPDSIDGGIWQRAYLNAFSATIGGGTSQIQANIVGEHVLGLSKS
jgi:alkylation response protein AidB-like acyl-CoA dehydrogenase